MGLGVGVWGRDCKWPAALSPIPQSLLLPLIQREVLTGGQAVIGLQQALELEDGFVVKGHGGKVGRPQAGFGQHVSRCLGEKARVVLLPSEPFFHVGLPR